MNTHLMSTTIEKAYSLNDIRQTFDNCEIEWKSKLNILTKNTDREKNAKMWAWKSLPLSRKLSYGKKKCDLRSFLYA
jgi:hypothetical protein